MSLLSRTKKLFAKKPVPKKSAPTPGEVPSVPLAGEAAGRARLDIEPLLSEKAFAVQGAESTAVFRVPRHAAKRAIAKEITQHYGAEVLDVRTSVVRGKSRRRGTTSGTTAAWKKAYVRVKDIQALNQGEA